MWVPLGVYTSETYPVMGEVLFAGPETCPKTVPWLSKQLLPEQEIYRTLGSLPREPAAQPPGDRSPGPTGFAMEMGSSKRRGALPRDFSQTRAWTSTFSSSSQNPAGHFCPRPKASPKLKIPERIPSLRIYSPAQFAHNHLAAPRPKQRPFPHLKGRKKRKKKK